MNAQGMLRSLATAASRIAPRAAARGTSLSQGLCCARQGGWVRSFSDAAGGGGAKRPGGSAKSRQKRINEGGPVTWQGVGLLVVAGSGLVYYYSTQEQERLARLKETKLGTGIGTPDLGGPFDLIDHNGKRKSDLDFRGKWMFIYFGFTYCPDICPNELTRLREIMDVLDADPTTKHTVEPVFITIDPERDGPLQLKEYLLDWHPRMIGLTGTPEAISKVCKQYRVYMSKAKLGDGPNDYLVDHSILFYLVSPDGKFIDYFGKALSPEAIAEKMTKYITGTNDITTHAPDSIGILPVPPFQYPDTPVTAPRS